MSDRVVIFCDESLKQGSHFSNFYGGALLDDADVQKVNRLLNSKKTQLGFHGEVKYTKITENYQQKYIDLVKYFFELVASGTVKIRIMFTQNLWLPKGLTSAQRDNEYFMLYYQMIKHSFGLQYIPGCEPVHLHINLDKLPNHPTRCAEFVAHLINLHKSSDFWRRKICISRSDISEVDSHNHPILQCLDIILGCMQGKLNENFKQLPPGKKRRAKKTKAKEAVYKAVYSEICKLYPGYQFNPGVSTRADHTPEFSWSAPYRHWLFTPTNAERNVDYNSKH